MEQRVPSPGVLAEILRLGAPLLEILVNGAMALLDICL